MHEEMAQHRRDELAQITKEYEQAIAADKIVALADTQGLFREVIFKTGRLILHGVFIGPLPPMTAAQLKVGMRAFRHELVQDAMGRSYPEAVAYLRQEGRDIEYAQSLAHDAIDLLLIAWYGDEALLAYRNRARSAGDLDRAQVVEDERLLLRIDAQQHENAMKTQLGQDLLAWMGRETNLIANHRAMLADSGIAPPWFLQEPANAVA